MTGPPFSPDPSSRSMPREPAVGGADLTAVALRVLQIDSIRTHLHVLARLGRIIQLPGFLDELRSAEDSGTAYSAICSADERLGADPT